MAPNHRFQTDVYLEVFDMLKVVSEAQAPWGGKKMSHDMWLQYLKEIVEGDIKLDELSHETVRLRQEVVELNSSAVVDHAQLRKIKVKFLDLEWSALFNSIKLRKQIDHADSLKERLKCRYID